MVAEVLLFLVLGVAAGVAMGIVPGVHPNMIVLAVPLIVSMGIPVPYVIVFLVALAVTNTFVDFVPSVMLGATEAGNELAALPGHKMVLEGRGYEAVKLVVLGGMGSFVLCILLLPLIAFIFPPLYEAVRAYTHLLLMFVALVMILTENSAKKKCIAAFVFLFSGVIGFAAALAPVNGSLALFPMLSGFFGTSVLLMQLRSKTSVPQQKLTEFFVSNRTLTRGTVSGLCGGVVAGLLPGVGPSQVASLVSIEKNDKSFLVSIGALAAANTVVSLAALWLIGKSRSGVAVAVEQLSPVGFSEFALIIAAAAAAGGAAIVVSLWLARRLAGSIGNINYAALNAAVLVLLLLLVVAFTGLYGLLLAVICTGFGIFVSLSGVKRGLMMGSLMLPVMVFYLGLP